MIGWDRSRRCAPPWRGVSCKPCRRRRRGWPPHSPRWGQTCFGRFRNIGIRARTGTRRDPSETLFGLDAGKHPYFAWYQKAHRFYGKPDPTDIGDDRDPLAARGMLQPEVEIVPRGTRKSRVELVIEPDLVVAFPGLLDRRHQDVVAVLHRHSSRCNDADNVLGKALDEFEHRLVPRKPRGTWPGSPALGPCRWRRRCACRTSTGCRW